MSRIEDARHALSNALTQIRELMASAMESAKFEEVALLASWAKDLVRMVEAGNAGATYEKSASAPIRPNRSAKSQSTSKTRKASTPQPASKPEYPRFEREDGKLVKIGRSKKGDAVYEHKAPVEAVLAMCAKIEDLTTKRTRFQVDDLGEVQAEGVSVPSYQLYLSLAWLKWSGLILQHGRTGYSVAAPKGFMKTVRAALQQLVER